MRDLSTAQVMKCLGLTRRSMGNLDKRGLLSSDVHGGFSVECVNWFLNRCARNFGGQLTWDDLESGRVVLMLAGEVRAKYNLTSYALRAACQRLNLPHVVLELGDPRTENRLYTQKSMERYAMGKRTSMPIAWVMGYPDEETFRVAHGIRPSVHLTQQVLRDHLQRALPRGADVGKWLCECRAAKRPPVRLAEVAARMDVSPELAFKKLTESGVAFVPVRTGGAQEARFTPLWETPEEDRYAPAGYTAVARLFDTSESMVTKWQTHITCPLGHRHGRVRDWYHICWLALITQDASLDTAAQLHRLWRGRMFGAVATPLLGADGAAALMNVSKISVLRAVEGGGLCGLRTPGGTLRFAKEWLT